ncbi:MAG: formate--tetrahydrofolate ligase [Proteobacteria bacterium]|nr:formate--tetrahydrofolate ligase [Pseudomonadota bacterium]
MQTDIAIAQQAKLKRITEIATKRLGIPEEHVEPYGHYKAKLTNEFVASLKDKPDGKLILVTAISPTPAGEGKTTTTVGLGDAMNAIGKDALICLREPSLGPVFGVKGGAAGGGFAQIVPMEDINLHFTGDFNAIQLANNLLAAMLDNHIHHGNALGIDVRRITWRRVLDMNDRALRSIVVSLGGAGNGYPREDGFDIVVASEVMAILCLAESMKDLKERLGRIVVAYTRDKKPVLAAELEADGAMAVLLKDAVKPNLVQTLENNPAIIHGGPFANIAHGCNSVIATRTSLKLADYVITEAGFGADLGAEKFIDIKCRKSGLRPDVVVLVATIRALKFHGGIALADLNQENLKALEVGFANLERHVNNMRNVFNLPCVVSINHFTHDSDAEIALLQKRCDVLGVSAVVSKHWAEGGKGARALALKVVDIIENEKAELRFAYEDEDSLEQKIESIAKKIYGAAEVKFDTKAKTRLAELEQEGHGALPVCIAKTQYSFSSDPSLKGAPTGHTLTVREIRLSAGAGFVVVVCGDIMTMPGLPKVPAASRIDLNAGGKVVGLF